MAWESARERAILAGHTAPHLVRACRGSRRSHRDLPRFAAAGTARGPEDRRRAARRRAPQHAGTRPRTAASSPEEARLWAPALARWGLRGGLLHWDCQLEDDARLVIALARTAAAHGRA